LCGAIYLKVKAKFFLKDKIDNGNLFDVIPTQLISQVYRVIELKIGELAIANFDSIIRIWNIDIKSQVRTLIGHLDTVRALIQNKDGHLVSCSCDSSIKVWNCTTGVLEKILIGHKYCVFDLVFSDEQTLLSCSADKTIKIWNLKKHVIVKNMTENSEFMSLLLLNNLNLASGSSNGKVIIWNLKSHQIINYLYGHLSWVTSLVYLENFYFASASRDFTIKIWDYEVGEEMRTLLGHKLGIFSIVLLKNGYLASASADKLIKIWNYSSGHLISTFTGHSKYVFALCLLKNGNLASASMDGDIRIWRLVNEFRNSTSNITFKICIKILVVKFIYFCNILVKNTSRLTRKISIKVKASLEESHLLLNTIKLNHPVLTIVLLTETILAVGDASPVISILNIKSKVQTQRLIGDTSKVDGKYGLIPLNSEKIGSYSQDSTIRIWNATSGKILKILLGHESSVFSMTLISNNVLMSGTWDQTIRIWNSTTGKNIKTMSGGDIDVIECFLLLDNGQRLASGERYSLIKLWIIEKTFSISLVTTLEGHTGKVKSMVNIRRGHLVSASNDMSMNGIMKC
jgi:WD40 repeat protein